MSLAVQSQTLIVPNHASMRDRIHQRALEISNQYKKSESALMEVLEQVENHQVYLHLGRSSLFQYGVQDLVSQSKAAHASLEESLIEMMDFYLKHKDPVTKAKREYVKKGLAKSSSQKLVEVKENAKVLAPDKKSEDQLVSIQANDATILERQTVLEEPKVMKREPIPASVLHQVHLRDQRCCTHLNSRNERCNQTHWIEIHHQTPVSQGGKNTVENLTTLCSTHHDWVHQQSPRHELSGHRLLE